MRLSIKAIVVCKSNALPPTRGTEGIISRMKINQVSISRFRCHTPLYRPAANELQMQANTAQYSAPHLLRVSPQKKSKSRANGIEAIHHTHIWHALLAKSEEGSSDRPNYSTDCDLHTLLLGKF